MTAPDPLTAQHALPAERSLIDPDGVEFSRLHSDEVDDATGREMLAVFADTFGRWPVLDPEVPLLDYLRWKTSGPFTRIAAIQARVDGRIVFTTTSMAGWMRVDGKRLLRVVLLDAAMLPAYQGRKIFSRSVAHRTRLAGTAYDLSLHERGSSPRNQSPLQRRGQTTIANPPTRRFRVLRPLPFARALGRPALAPIALALSWIGGAFESARRRALRRRGLVPQDVLRFDDRFDALFEEAAPDFDVICERDATFLRWRYGDRRAGAFVVRAITDGERLLGYAVLRLAGARAFVADLLAMPGRDDVVEALLADATALARRSGAAGIECWLTGRHPYRRALARQGYFDSRVETAIEYHPVRARAEDLERLRDPRARVHFLRGDTDLV